MFNQGIRIFTENFQRICVFPGFVKKLLHIFTKLKSVNMCNWTSLMYYTRNKLETSHINLTVLCLTSHHMLLYVNLLQGLPKDTIKYTRRMSYNFKV